jgi:hypothetical protein
MEIYLFDYNVREGLSEKQAVAWVALHMTHCNPISLYNLNTRVLCTNPLIDKQNN